MKIYLYKLNTENARPMPLAEMRGAVEKALAYVAKSSNGQVGFWEDDGKGRLPSAPVIEFMFAEFDDVEDTAQWSEPLADKFEVRFNYHLNWSTQWWHKWRPLRVFKGPSHDLLTSAVHEIGHVMGMYPRLKGGGPYHNPDKWSVMNERPITHKFTAIDIGTLRYVTHPDYRPIP